MTCIHFLTLVTLEGEGRQRQLIKLLLNMCHISLETFEMFDLCMQRYDKFTVLKHVHELLISIGRRYLQFVLS